MPEYQETTVAQSHVAKQIVTAGVIHVGQLAETASVIPPVRTVTTSQTTGTVSVRFVPRPVQPGGGTDTES